jgi:cytochrome c oxidase subunit 1
MTALATQETGAVVPSAPHAHETNTGVSNNKLGIWLFIASESLFFGAFIIALAVMLYIVNVLYTRQRGEVAPADPWDARSLEWMTSSPPPEYNFAEIPVIEHRDEFWHRKYTEDDQGRLVALPESERYVVPARRDPHESHNIHMPSPSYWPFVFCLGLPILGYGFVFKNWWLVAAGAVWLMFGMTGWATEPSTEPGS